MASTAAVNGEVTWGRAVPALVCILCSRRVGEVIGGKIVHHRNRDGSLTRVGRTIRCCNCGGSVAIEVASKRRCT